MAKYDLSQYHDRGIMKWQGFFLSEHTSAINAFKKDEYHVTPQKPLMDEQEISNVIEEALLKKLPVAIQLQEVNLDGQYAADVVGDIRGYSTHTLQIGNRGIPFDLIRHVAIADRLKWSAL